MQKRHQNRATYFRELSTTSKEYFVPYIRHWHPLGAGVNVLEIGCGDGGNLLPFARLGCHTVGVDIAACRIEDAKKFFEAARAKGEFIAEDFFRLHALERRFDIIVCHDVLEHIAEKERFLSGLGKFLKPGGIVFMSFPAWQMPFGGHQQICKSAVLSHLPFIHLLPAAGYRRVLKAFGEKADCIKELLSIQQTGITIERFESLVRRTTLNIQDRQLWLVNPHYKIKFGLSPRKLHPALSSLPYARNFFCTSCFYILKNMYSRRSHDSAEENTKKLAPKASISRTSPERER